MMEKKYLFVTLIIALLAINVFTLVRFKKLQLIFATMQSAETGNGNVYQIDLANSVLNSNFRLPNVLIKDSVNEMHPLKTTFDNSQKQMLVCRFSQAHCESCVNSSIQMIKTWSQSIGDRNIMFLDNHPNNRIFRKSIPLYGIQGMKIYNVDSFDIPAEQLGYPYFFILDQNLQISNVFVPDKGEPQITNLYMEKIKERFYPEVN